MLAHGLVLLEHLLHLNVYCAMLVHGPLHLELLLTRNATCALLVHGLLLLEQRSRLNVMHVMQDCGL